MRLFCSPPAGRVFILFFLFNVYYLSRKPCSSQTVQPAPIQPPLAIGPQYVGAPQTGLASNTITNAVAAAAAAAAAANTAMVASPPQSNSAYLASEEPIVQLDYSSINDEILRKRTANFVYYNADPKYCRYCHRFYNLWREVAMDIRSWRQVVRLFVINCSDEDNIEVCRRAGVTQFPQVKYYWISSNDLDQDGQRMRILGKSVHALRHMILDKVLESYVEQNRLLAQRAKQQQQHSLASSPPTTATGSVPTSLSNPQSMSTLMSQFLAGAGPAGSANLASLTSLMNMFAKPNKQAGQQPSLLLPPMNPDQPGGGAAGAASLGSLMAGTSPIAGLLAGLAPGAGAGGGGGGPNVAGLIGMFMDANSMHKKMNLQPVPANWPELEPIDPINTQQLIEMFPLDTVHNIGALLIMETSEFLYTGPEVMLDLSPYSNQTYIARVRDEHGEFTKNLTKRDDIQAPALIYITAGQEPRLILTAPKYTNDEDLRKAFVKAFERRQVKYPVKRVWSTTSGQQSANIGNKQAGDSSDDDADILSRLNSVYMDDLINAIRASLMEQVFRHPDLTDDQYNALVKYVYALINYFPFNNDDTLKLFKRLHAWLQNQVSPLDIGEYKKQFHDVDEIMPRRDWVACKSLSNVKSLPSRHKKTVSLFENPAQIGKMVSNLTHLLRGQQQQASKLKNLYKEFSTSSSSLPATQATTGQQLTGNNGQGVTLLAPNVTVTPAPTSPSVTSNPNTSAKRDSDSPIERIIKSFTSGSLGTDSSILKLISTALTGASGDPSGTGSPGKSKFAREYSCGAWKLAHTMVVNEYIKDSPRKDVKHIVMHSLYQYMVQFYACPTCGNRVSDVSGEFKLNLDDNLHEQVDSVMLLWKLHNRVSKRLESELRPGSPIKIQFPSESLCPKCRSPRTQNDLVPTPNWHDKQVLNFLVHHYRPQSIIANTNSSGLDASSSASRAWQMTWPVGRLGPLLVAIIVSLCMHYSRPLKGD